MTAPLIAGALPPGRRLDVRPSRAAGFLLVEVLVALVVVAVGILALASLLQAAARHARLAELRATATMLADDIADRLRVNAAGAAAAGYDLAGAGFPSAVAPPHAPCTRASPCDPLDLARSDLADWTTRVHAALPKGSAWIRRRPAAPASPRVVDVWVAWSDPLAPSAPDAGEDAGPGCPAAWRRLAWPVRCVHLQVAL